MCIFEKHNISILYTHSRVTSQPAHIERCLLETFFSSFRFFSANTIVKRIERGNFERNLKVENRLGKSDFGKREKKLSEAMWGWDDE